MCSEDRSRASCWHWTTDHFKAQGTKSPQLPATGAGLEARLQSPKLLNIFPVAAHAQWTSVQRSTCRPRSKECVSDWISRFRGFFLRFGDCLGLLWLFWGLRKTWETTTAAKIRWPQNKYLQPRVACRIIVQSCPVPTRPRRGELAPARRRYWVCGFATLQFRLWDVTLGEAATLGQRAKW